MSWCCFSVMALFRPASETGPAEFSFCFDDQLSYIGLLAYTGKARGCYTNTVVINQVTSGVLLSSAVLNHTIKPIKLIMFTGVGHWFNFFDSFARRATMSCPDVYFCLSKPAYCTMCRAHRSGVSRSTVLPCLQLLKIWCL